LRAGARLGRAPPPHRLRRLRPHRAVRRPAPRARAARCRAEQRLRGRRPRHRPPRRLQRLPLVHELTREQARRIAVRAQLLDARRPTELVGLVRHLTLLQIDPTAAIAPSADLVAWSRLGSCYRPEQLKEALEDDRTLFERDALVRPMDDVGLHLAGAADFPDYERARVWLRDNDRFRRDILKLLKASGPLGSREIPDTCAVPWA